MDVFASFFAICALTFYIYVVREVFWCNGIMDLGSKIQRGGVVTLIFLTCVLWRIVYLAREQIHLPLHEKGPHEFIAAEHVFIDARHQH
jgi:hypothetical protein